jgi:hypothetical protein
MQPDFEEVARATDPARRHLDHRAEARRKRILKDNPDTGAFLLAMSDEPMAPTAFDSGAPWERWVAELVRQSFPQGIFLFHRKRGADRPGDIDIVAVLPSGIWTIDIQRHEDAVAEVRHTTGPEGRRDYLFLDEVDRTAILDDLDDQAGAVAAALLRSGFGRIAVRSVLCLVDAEPAWRGSPTVGTTYVSKARPMLKILGAGPVVFDETEVASLGLALDRQLGRQLPKPDKAT